MKITKTQLKQIIKEELSKVLSEGEDDIDTPEGPWVLEGGRTLEALVKDEFQVWQKEQKAKFYKFQPGLGAGGGGATATQRHVVFNKVERTLIQDYGFMDSVDAYKLKNAGEQYDEEKVIAVGKPIYKKIYAILYDLIPRSRYEV